ncbi:MAG: glycosyltransferase family 4 protein [Ignavibacteria bacterium]|nr:glycosyltransferase family 4 protein [Ignavibacteria bacterium]
MKKVLVVAYHFPPGGGPGVQRVLKHVTYLREFGWQPIVLTVKDGEFPARDESLLAKIPNDVVVERAAIVEPYAVYKRFMGRQTAVDVNVNKSKKQRTGFKERIAEVIRATFFIPDARIGWLGSASKLGVDMVRRHGVDAIYTSSPPYTCSLIGKRIKRQSNLPWVAGFRDPWTGFLTTPDRWFLPAAIDRGLERSVFQTADAVECAWQGIIDDAMSKYPHLNAGKFHLIPNGYDSADFPQFKPAANDVFTVTYTGSMYGRRNPQTFLQALDRLMQQGRISPSMIRLRFIGRFGDDVADMFSSSQFASSIENIPYVPHVESLKWLMKSDVSLLIVDESKESDKIVPGKVYEYLGIGKPVLALSPQGSAISELIKETQSGVSIPQQDVDGIAKALLEYFGRWEQKIPLATPSISRIQRFERREAARQLAQLLDSFTENT